MGIVRVLILASTLAPIAQTARDGSGMEALAPEGIQEAVASPALAQLKGTDDREARAAKLQAGSKVEGAAHAGVNKSEVQVASSKQGIQVLKGGQFQQRSDYDSSAAHAVEDAAAAAVEHAEAHAEGPAEGAEGHGELHEDAHAEGHAEGHAEEGSAEGHGELHEDVHAEGHAEGHADEGSAEGHDELHEDVHVEGHAEGHAESHPVDHAEGHFYGAEHEEVDERQFVVGRALGYALLGSVAWIMLFFYQLQSEDEDIVQATWRILYDMIAIFVAVLLFSSTKNFTIDFFGEDPGHHHAPPDQRALVIAAVRLLMFYVIVLAILLSLRGKQTFGLCGKTITRTWALTIVAGIGGHAMGFAAIDVFGNFLEYEPLRSSVPMAAVTAIVLFAMLVVLLWAGSRALNRLTQGDGEWLEVMEDCENDGACLCLGLMVSMIARDSITGHMPALHGDPKGKTATEVWTLLGVASAMGVAVVALAVVGSRMERSKSHMPLSMRDDSLTTAPLKSNGSRGTTETNPPSSFMEDFKPKNGGCLACCGIGGRPISMDSPVLHSGSAQKGFEERGPHGSRPPSGARRELYNEPQAPVYELTSLPERAVKMLQLTVSLGMGWCLLYWGQWFFWNITGGRGVGTGSVMTARMLMSLMFTVLCFVAMRVIDRFADFERDHGQPGVSKGLRELLRVFGLLMGLSWEACFVHAVEDISAGSQGHNRTFLVSGITLALGMVVVPAWALYILPRVLEAEEEERRNQQEAAHRYGGALE